MGWGCVSWMSAGACAARRQSGKHGVDTPTPTPPPQGGRRRVTLCQVRYPFRKSVIAAIVAAGCSSINQWPEFWITTDFTSLAT